MSTAVPQPLLTVHQIATMLNVKTRTVYDLAKLAGDEPSNPKGLSFMFRVGGSWRARAKDVEIWIDQRAKVRYQ
jgi:hypothetical protein